MNNRAIAVIAAGVLVIAGIVIFHRRGHSAHSIQKATFSHADLYWLKMGNQCEAEALTGHGIPYIPSLDLLDVKDFDGISQFVFADLTSHQEIGVYFADSHPDMTAQQFNAAWYLHADKLRSAAGKPHRSGKSYELPSPRVQGQKQFKLENGDIIKADRISVPLFNGKYDQGMQTTLQVDGRMYHLLGYGDPFNEADFEEFVRRWQATPFIAINSAGLTAEQQSMGYTKRGEFLSEKTIRQPDAIDSFQKAIRLDPNNSEARIQLQLLSQRMKLPQPSVPLN